ncbi:cyclic nucleotide-binding domain-containing protein [Spirulina sp. 06S082]|uniref:cyclic nucleotide-binding domain-containing protein n=1 Tax=Spirulina sp. 06S082 TaxID=3110248 RepID=UPI002B2139D3|nr:cyclic nucleotide-binding domain-containing protein [Spirulina sp. 06S082]MEA5472105.1 cyclic nucleotide-binding domain-containing protein [Spirulina sp. 06S082]
MVEAFNVQDSPIHNQKSVKRRIDTGEFSGNFSNRLEQFKILEKLSESQLNSIESLCEEKTYQPGEFLFQEGEEQDKVYFLLSGTVGVYKTDLNTETDFKFTEISAGNILGEISLVDVHIKGFTVKAETEITVYGLSKQKLIAQIPQHQKILDRLNPTIIQQTLGYIQTLSDRYATAMQKQVEDLKERDKLSHFLFLLIFGFFLAISLEEFVDMFPDRNLAESTLFHWVYLIIVGFIPAILLFVKVDVPFKKLIDIKTNFIKSVLDGLIFSAVGVASIFVLCVVLHQIIPEENLLPSFLSMSFSVTTLFYFIHSYFQQFVRATVQTLVQRFLVDNKGYISVAVTALAFGIVHAQYGFESMIVTLGVSIFFGLIYRRTYNLLGVSIVHFVLGSVYFHMGR